MKEIIVENIKCHGCAHTITDRLNNLEGISSTEVEVETGTVRFESSNEDMMDEVKAELLKMGYPQPGEGQLTTTAKSFISCMIGRVNK